MASGRSTQDGGCGHRPLRGRHGACVADPVACRAEGPGRKLGSPSEVLGSPDGPALWGAGGQPPAQAGGDRWGVKA